MYGNESGLNRLGVPVLTSPPKHQTHHLLCFALIKKLHTAMTNISFHFEIQDTDSFYLHIKCVFNITMGLWSV